VPAHGLGSALGHLAGRSHRHPPLWAGCPQPGVVPLAADFASRLSSEAR